MLHTIAATLLAMAPLPAAPPAIEFWYGDDQVFGRLGRPQRQINILGNVDADALVELTYSLDGGPEFDINWGPDNRRLTSPGDFNIELYLEDLSPGIHQVTVRAIDANDAEASRSMRFLLFPEREWPLPYDTEWNTTDDVTVRAQPVDGLWTRVPGGVRCPVTGYDRILAIGDMQWTDYDVTVPVTIHSVDANVVVPGVGIIMRWNGHTDFFKPGSQPTLGYWPLGAAAEYDYHPDQCGPRLQLYGNPYVLRDQDDGCTTQLDFDVTYLWRVRVRTLPNNAFDYRFKVWPQGSPEPNSWILSMVENADQPAHGSILLLAHHVDVTFGDVVVKPARRYYPAAASESPVPPVTAAQQN